MSRSIRVFGLCLIVSHVAPLAAEPPARPSARDMAQRVDAMLAKRWKEAGVAPAAPARDSTWLRRVYLDLHGVNPRVAEVRAFLRDTRPEKRAELVDRLLALPRHATHLANTWRRIMLPGGVDLEQLQNVAGVQNWLRDRFAENMRYDRIVSDFLVETGGGEAGPALFYTSLDLQPEKLAASTSRIFLGLRIECAECHPHPFDDWTQTDFWGYAAFFAQVGQVESMQQDTVALVDLKQGEVTLPGTDTVVPPKFLGGEPAAESGGTRRDRLAIWMASRDNPYLARAAVNRVWAHLFGRGLVEPVDDLGKHNPPSHPEVMDALCDFFVATGFDVRELMRALALTDAYQRASQAEDPHPLSLSLFAHMPVKALSSDQLYDCLDRVLMRPPGDTRSFVPAATGIFDPVRLSFTSRMQMQGANATEFEAGVLQALTMLNGRRTEALTSAEQCGLLMGLQAPWMNDEERVETLFLAALSRYPDDEERQAFVQYVATGGASGNASAALGDVLWALFNSAEFVLNH